LKLGWNFLYKRLSCSEAVVSESEFVDNQRGAFFRNVAKVPLKFKRILNRNLPVVPGFLGLGKLRIPSDTYNVQTPRELRVVLEEVMQQLRHGDLPVIWNPEILRVDINERAVASVDVFPIAVGNICLKARQEFLVLKETYQEDDIAVRAQGPIRRVGNIAYLCPYFNGNCHWRKPRVLRRICPQ
jgi:hypothetical protein